MKLKYLDVILVDFGKEVVGSEQGGIRPAIVVQNNVGNKYSNTTIVMPCTSQMKKLTQPTHTILRKSKESGLSKDSVVEGEGVRQISEERIIRYLGKITDEKEKNEIKRVYYANTEN